MYFPQFKLLNMAEDANHTMHNLYTIRGAEIRDGRLWSRYIGEAIERYGDRTDVRDRAASLADRGAMTRIVAFLEEAARLYKFIHDQSAAAAQPRPDARPEIAETAEAAGRASPVTGRRAAITAR